jgi:hypothetical protein
MDGRPERPIRLLVALAIPVVGLAALGVAVAVTHKQAPPTRRPSPQPVALPSPTVFPELFPTADDFRLAGPRAYGTVSGPLARIPPDYTFDLTLAASPTGLPDALPVWRIVPAPLDPLAVAAPFGLAGTPSSTAQSADVTQWSAGLVVDTALTRVAWQPLRDSANPRLGGLPRDATTAFGLAEAWLDHAGFTPPSGPPATVEQTSNGQGAAFAEWRITWPRAAAGYTRWPIDTTVARVSADGTLKELELSRPVVAGGSLYRLRPWQDALTDARQGRWAAPFQPLPDFTTPGVVHTTVTISMVYGEARNALGSFAVPMYAFSGPCCTHPGLVPALAP